MDSVLYKPYDSQEFEHLGEPEFWNIDQCWQWVESQDLHAQNALSRLDFSNGLPNDADIQEALQLYAEEFQLRFEVSQTGYGDSGAVAGNLEDYTVAISGTPSDPVDDVYGESYDNTIDQIYYSPEQAFARVKQFQIDFYTAQSHYIDVLLEKPDADHKYDKLTVHLLSAFLRDYCVDANLDTLTFLPSALQEFGGCESEEANDLAWALKDDFWALLGDLGVTGRDLTTMRTSYYADNVDDEAAEHNALWLDSLTHELITRKAQENPEIFGETMQAISKSESVKAIRKVLRKQKRDLVALKIELEQVDDPRAMTQLMHCFDSQENYEFILENVIGVDKGIMYHVNQDPNNNPDPSRFSEEQWNLANFIAESETALDVDRASFGQRVWSVLKYYPPCMLIDWKLVNDTEIGFLGHVWGNVRDDYDRSRADEARERMQDREQDVRQPIADSEVAYATPDFEIVFPLADPTRQPADKSDLDVIRDEVLPAFEESKEKLLEMRCTGEFEGHTMPNFVMHLFKMALITFSEFDQTPDIDSERTRMQQSLERYMQMLFGMDSDCTNLAQYFVDAFANMKIDKMSLPEWARAHHQEINRHCGGAYGDVPDLMTIPEDFETWFNDNVVEHTEVFAQLEEASDPSVSISSFNQTLHPIGHIKDQLNNLAEKTADSIDEIQGWTSDDAVYAFFTKYCPNPAGRDYLLSLIGVNLDAASQLSKPDDMTEAQWEKSLAFSDGFNRFTSTQGQAQMVSMGVFMCACMAAAFMNPTLGMVAMAGMTGMSGLDIYNEAEKLKRYHTGLVMSEQEGAPDIVTQGNLENAQRDLQAAIVAGVINVGSIAFSCGVSNALKKSIPRIGPRILVDTAFGAVDAAVSATAGDERVARHGGAEQAMLMAAVFGLAGGVGGAAGDVMGGMAGMHPPATLKPFTKRCPAEMGFKENGAWEVAVDVNGRPMVFEVDPNMKLGTDGKNGIILHSYGDTEVRLENVDLTKGTAEVVVDQKKPLLVDQDDMDSVARFWGDDSPVVDPNVEASVARAQATDVYPLRADDEGRARFRDAVNENSTEYKPSTDPDVPDPDFIDVDFIERTVQMDDASRVDDSFFASVFREAFEGTNVQTARVIVVDEATGTARALEISIQTADGTPPTVAGRGSGPGPGLLGDYTFPLRPVGDTSDASSGPRTLGIGADEPCAPGYDLNAMGELIAPHLSGMKTPEGHVLLSFTVDDVTNVHGRQFERMIRDICEAEDINTARIVFTDERTGYTLTHDIQVNPDGPVMPPPAPRQLDEPQMQALMTEIYGTHAETVMERVAGWPAEARERFYADVSRVYAELATPHVSVRRVRIFALTPRSTDGTQSNPDGFRLVGPKDYQDPISDVVDRHTQAQEYRSDPLTDLPAPDRRGVYDIPVGRDGKWGVEEVSFENMGVEGGPDYLIQNSGMRCPFLALVNAYQAQGGSLSHLEMANGFRHVMENTGERLSSTGYQPSKIFTLNQSFGGNPRSVIGSAQTMPEILDAVHSGQVVIFFQDGGTRVAMQNADGGVSWFNFNRHYKKTHDYDANGLSDRGSLAQDLEGRTVYILEPDSVGRMLGLEPEVSQRRSSTEDRTLGVGAADPEEIGTGPVRPTDIDALDDGVVPQAELRGLDHVVRGETQSVVTDGDVLLRVDDGDYITRIDKETAERIRGFEDERAVIEFNGRAYEIIVRNQDRLGFGHEEFMAFYVDEQGRRFATVVELRDDSFGIGVRCYEQGDVAAEMDALVAHLQRHSEFQPCLGFVESNFGTSNYTRVENLDAGEVLIQQAKELAFPYEMSLKEIDIDGERQWVVQIGEDTMRSSIGMNEYTSVIYRPSSILDGSFDTTFTKQDIERLTKQCETQAKRDYDELNEAYDLEGDPDEIMLSRPSQRVRLETDEGTSVFEYSLNDDGNGYLDFDESVVTLYVDSDKPPSPASFSELPRGLNIRPLSDIGIEASQGRQQAADGMALGLGVPEHTVNPRNTGGQKYVSELMAAGDPGSVKQAQGYVLLDSFGVKKTAYEGVVRVDHKFKGTDSEGKAKTYHFKGELIDFGSADINGERIYWFVLHDDNAEPPRSRFMALDVTGSLIEKSDMVGSRCYLERHMNHMGDPNVQAEMRGIYKHFEESSDISLQGRSHEECMVLCTEIARVFPHEVAFYYHFNGETFEPRMYLGNATRASYGNEVDVNLLAFHNHPNASFKQAALQSALYRPSCLDIEAYIYELNTLLEHMNGGKEPAIPSNIDIPGFDRKTGTYSSLVGSTFGAMQVQVKLVDGNEQFTLNFTHLGDATPTKEQLVEYFIAEAAKEEIDVTADQINVNFVEPDQFSRQTGLDVSFEPIADHAVFDVAPVIDAADVMQGSALAALEGIPPITEFDSWLSAMQKGSQVRASSDRSLQDGARRMSVGDAEPETVDLTEAGTFRVGEDGEIRPVDLGGNTERSESLDADLTLQNLSDLSGLKVRDLMSEAVVEGARFTRASDTEFRVEDFRQMSVYAADGTTLLYRGTEVILKDGQILEFPDGRRMEFAQPQWMHGDRVEFEMGDFEGDWMVTGMDEFGNVVVERDGLIQTADPSDLIRAAEYDEMAMGRPLDDDDLAFLGLADETVEALPTLAIQAQPESYRSITEPSVETPMGPAGLVHTVPTHLDVAEIFVVQSKNKHVGSIDLVRDAQGQVVVKFTEESSGFVKYFSPKEVLTIRRRDEMLSDSEHDLCRVDNPQFPDKSINRSLEWDEEKGVWIEKKAVMVDMSDPRLVSFLHDNMGDIRRRLDAGEITKKQAAEEAYVYIRDNVKYDEARGYGYKKLPQRMFNLAEFLGIGICNERGQLLQVSLQYIGVESTMQKVEVLRPGGYFMGKHALVKVTDPDVVVGDEVWLLDPQEDVPLTTYLYPNDEPYMRVLPDPFDVQRQETVELGMLEGDTLEVEPVLEEAGDLAGRTLPDEEFEVFQPPVDETATIPVRGGGGSGSGGGRSADAVVFRNKQRLYNALADMGVSQEDILREVSHYDDSVYCNPDFFSLVRRPAIDTTGWERANTNDLTSVRDVVSDAASDPRVASPGRPNITVATREGVQDFFDVWSSRLSSLSFNEATQQSFYIDAEGRIFWDEPDLDLPLIEIQTSSTGNYVLRERQGSAVLNERMIVAGEFISVNGHEIFLPPFLEAYFGRGDAPVVMEPVSHIDFGGRTFDDYAFANQLETLGVSIEPGANHVTVELTVDDVTKLTRNQLEMPVKTSLEDTGVGWCVLMIRDRETGAVFRSEILVNPGQPKPQKPKPLLRSTIERGQRLSHRSLGPDNYAILERTVSAWPQDVQERFWVEIESLATEQLEPRFGIAFNKNKPITIKKQQELSKYIDDLASIVDSYHQPLISMQPFRRFTGTPKQAVDYHQANPKPDDYLSRPGQTGSFIDESGQPQDYFVPDYVQEKINGWMHLVTHGLNTETKGQLVVETREDGTVMIVDFIPSAALSESLYYQTGDRYGEAQMQTLTFPYKSERLARILDYENELAPPISIDDLTVINLHTHYYGDQMQSHYPNSPSPADFDGTQTSIDAVFSPSGNLVLFIRTFRSDPNHGQYTTIYEREMG